MNMKARRLSMKDSGYKIMYSSFFNGFVTDPALMIIPFDDHMVVRGHGVFDTCTIVNGKAIKLNTHLERFKESAESARIPIPYQSIDDVRQVILDTCAASGARDGFVRYYVTAGAGDCGWLPSKEGSCFYCLIHDSVPNIGPIREYTINTSQVPMRTGFLTTTKTTSYLNNVLLAMASVDRGGAGMGVWVDDQGYIAESSVCNVFFVFQTDKGFVMKTPPFDKVLKGSTARMVLEIGSKLKDTKNLLVEVSQAQVTLEEARIASEIFTTGGQLLHPIIFLDDKMVGNGEPGPIFKEVARYHKDYVDKGIGEDFTEIDYSSYAK